MKLYLRLVCLIAVPAAVLAVGCSSSVATPGSQCTGGMLFCGGACIPSGHDNCGKCGNNCGDNMLCVYGGCIEDTGCVDPSDTECPAGSGHCVDLSSDVYNCGSCANACGAGKTCVKGACT
jgi:hypothetical protein